MLHSCAPFTKTLVLPQRANSGNRNFIGLTLKEYFNLHSNQLTNIDEENQSETEADVNTPSFHNPKNTKQRPRRNRHKTELEEIIKEEGQQPLHKSNHRMVTLSLEELIANDKAKVKLPAIHELKHSQGRHVAREAPRKAEEPGSLHFGVVLKKEGSISKQVAGNERKSVRSRVTSTSFYHMHTHHRTKTEEETSHALQKSFIITRYGGYQQANKPKEDISLKRYEHSIRLSKH